MTALILVFTGFLVLCFVLPELAEHAWRRRGGK